MEEKSSPLGLMEALSLLTANMKGSLFAEGSALPANNSPVILKVPPPLYSPPRLLHPWP